MLPTPHKMHHILSMYKIMSAATLFIFFIVLLHHSNADVGTASRYSPPYLRKYIYYYISILLCSINLLLHKVITE